MYPMQTEKVVAHIVNWLKTYATEAKIKGFVIGVSGGIDSAVTSTLCAKTGLPTLCVEMPIHQAESQVSRAQEHIAQLKKRFENVSDTRVNLTATFEQLKSDVPSFFDNVFNVLNPRLWLLLNAFSVLVSFNNAVFTSSSDKSFSK